MANHYQPSESPNLLQTRAAQRLFLSGLYALGLFAVGTLALDVLGDRNQVQQLREICGDPTATIVPQTNR